MNEVRVAIIGFGGIARAHYAAYCQLAVDLKLAKHIQVKLCFGTVNYGNDQFEFFDRVSICSFCHN